MLIRRPTAVAKKFAQELEVAAQSDFETVSMKYFGGMRTDGAILEVKLSPRSWDDVLLCEQLFSMNMVRPTHMQNEWLVSTQDFYSTPVGVNEIALPRFEVRRVR